VETPERRRISRARSAARRRRAIATSAAARPGSTPQQTPRESSSRDAFVLTVLTTAVDCAECDGGRRRRRDPGQEKRGQQDRASSSHCSALPRGKSGVEGELTGSPAASSSQEAYGRGFGWAVLNAEASGHRPLVWLSHRQATWDFPSASALSRSNSSAVIVPESSSDFASAICWMAVRSPAGAATDLM
jgi:hypothetical protein